jgi:YHS domain-containing protein
MPGDAVGPLRIIILAVLFYIGYRLLKSSFSKKSGSQTTGNPSSEVKEQITDVLVEDPVCGKLVPQQQALKLNKNGETYYFCSNECCNQFASEKGDDE